MEEINLEANNKEFYDYIASEYNISCHPSSRYDRYHESMKRRFILKNMHLGKNLEIGHGPGTYTSTLTQISKHLTAIDISPKMQEICKENVKASNVSFILGDFLNINKNIIGPFGTIVLMAVLPHIRDLAKAFMTLRQFLAKDGIIIFDLWNSRSHCYKGLVKWRKDIASGRRSEKVEHEKAYTCFHNYEEMDNIIRKEKLKIVDEMGLNVLSFARFPKGNLLSLFYPITDRILSKIF